MSTEIGARNFGDAARYNMLKVSCDIANIFFISLTKMSWTLKGLRQSKYDVELAN